MVGYVRRIGAFGRDIRLFLIFNLLVYVGFGVFVLVYNLYLYELDLREDFIGAFNAVQTLTMAAAALTMGRPLQRFGVWRCITVATGCYLIVSLGLAFFAAPALLLAFSALLGVTIAYLATTTMPFIIEWGRRDQRAEIAALTFSLISLATMLGSLVGGFAPALIASPFPSIEPASAEAFRWTLVAGTGITVTALVPLLLMGEARRRRPRVDHAAATAAEPADVRRQVRKDTAVFVLVGGTMSLGAGMVFPFYNVYLREELGASAREVGFVFALGGLAAAVIGLGAPALGRKMGSLWAVFLVRNSILPFYLLLIFFPGYGLAVLTHLVRQTSVSMAWPLDSTFISEVLPPRARSSVFGLRSGVWNLGWSGASLLGGWIIVQVGYGWPFASLVFFTFISTVIYVTYYSRHPQVRAGLIPSALAPGKRAAVATAAAQSEPRPPTPPPLPAPASPGPTDADRPTTPA